MILNLNEFSKHYFPHFSFPPQSKTREQREAEVIPRVTKALSLGINVLDTAFEQLDPHIGDSDSEDEDSTYKAVDPILEPKVCPLPKYGMRMPVYGKVHVYILT